MSPDDALGDVRGVKQAAPSVYEPHAGQSRYRNHGQRVVVGKGVIQAATDIFARWTKVREHDSTSASSAT